MEILKHITFTKLIPPNRHPDLLSRRRLLDQLEALLVHKLIMIVAPVGCGKTSLLIDAAHKSAWPFCWCALEPTDQNLDHFITRVIASLTQVFPAVALQQPLKLSSAWPDKRALDQQLTTLVDLVNHTIQDRFVLVLDDYHLVQDNHDIDYFVNQFAWQVGEHCRLCLASDNLLNLSHLPQLAAQAQIGGIDFEALAFQPAELQALMLDAYHLPLSEAAATALVQATEGWVTGLVLLAQTRLQELGSTQAFEPGPYDDLFRRFLDQQPAPLRDFLLRTSFFDEFSADLCDLALERSKSQGKAPAWAELTETVSDHIPFGYTVTFEQSQWLRYHPIFKDFLQHRFVKENPGEKDRMLYRLGMLYTAGEAWEKVCHVLQQLDDPALVGDFIKQSGFTLIQQGRQKILAAWFEIIPPEMIAQDATLRSLKDELVAE